MSVIHLVSDQLDGTRRTPVDSYAKVRLLPFNIPAVAVAGDAGSDIKLVTLPAGRVRVLLGLSRIKVSALGASRVMDLGWAAYVGSDGVTPVNASQNGIANDVDVSGATDSGLAASPVWLDFFSQKGVDLMANVAGGTIPVGATAVGYVAILTE